jgi:glycosyltransferase involved in cell wall biosynthesis
MKVGLVTLTDTDTTLDLADALSNTGQSVLLYLAEKSCLRSGKSADLYIDNLYKKRVIPTSCHVNIYRWPRMRDPLSFTTAKKIRQQMQRDGIEVVHIIYGPAEPWLAVLANLLHEMPVVSTIIVPNANLGDPLAVWVEPLNKLLIHGSDMVIVNGKNQVDPVRTKYKIPIDRIVNIPLGARTTTIKSLSMCPAEQLGTVLFFGRADPHKGLEFLVRAQPFITQQVPFAKILIAANGTELARCRPMIQDENAFEIREGFVPDELMADYFARASVVALPYLTASTSGVLLTAYGFGKPVVATSVGCLPEYVKEGVTGLLVPPGDVEQLAAAIIRLLSDDSLRSRMGENGRLWVQELQESITKETIKAYEKAASIHSRNKR